MNAHWRAVRLSEEALGQGFEAHLRQALPRLTLFQDPDWLGARNADAEKDVLILLKGPGESPEAIATFVEHMTDIEFSLGEFTLFRKRVRRFTLDAGPAMQGEACREDVVACFESLASMMPKGGVGYLQGVAQQSELARLLNDPSSPLRARFRVLPFGREYQRCRIVWRGDIESYFASLASRTAKDLRRTWRKFTDAFAGEFETRRFSSPKDAPAFLADAAKVSDLTYQKRVLDRGLSESSEDEAELRLAAEKGYFMGYVLYVKGRPVAFDYGYRFGEALYLMQKGFDPAWREHKVGMVLGCEILHDLETRRIPVSVLDYMYGDNVYKIRTSNSRSAERNYYLFQRNLSGWTLAFSLQAIVRVSEGIGDFLEKHNLKDRVRRFIRHGLSQA